MLNHQEKYRPNPLCRAAALAAARNGDKVRANGVRAVGNLLAFVRVAPPADGVSNPNPNPGFAAERAWLADALRCLTGALADGGAKVQWNACFAAGSLLRNAPAAAAAAAAGGEEGAVLRSCDYSCVGSDWRSAELI